MQRIRPLFTAGQIEAKVSELGARISEDYAGRELLIVGILRGAFIFMADLVRRIDNPAFIDFITSSSYIKTSTSGEIIIHSDLREEVCGRHVLLVDDIIDTGISLDHIRNMLLQRQPASLSTCVLIDKRERRVKHVPLNYAGFVIDSGFVVGYGIDYEGRYRTLPCIGVLEGDNLQG